MKARNSMSDGIRFTYNVFLEPLIATAALGVAKKNGITRSKYIRDSVIEKLIRDGYPLSKVSNNIKLCI